MTLTAGQSKECETSDPTSFSSTTSHVSDDDHLNYDTTCVPGKNVGHYDLNVALGSKHNYAVRVVDNTFVIIPVQVSAVVVSGSKIYD
ncbi:MBG domain-containing protein [Pediococcus cellicola]|uniref:MBG domain-containing protein n=1 Tax=Pediococcus cellicola TaxID=319652 RepID=UPI00138F0B4C